MSDRYAMIRRMSDLTWRTARTLQLAEKLIPDPNAQHVLLDRLHSVRVAVEGAFLHVDPRQEGRSYPGGSEVEVYVVPAAAVRTVVYMEPVVADRAPIH